MSEIDDLVTTIRFRLDTDERTQASPLEQWHHRDCASLPDGTQLTFECDCGVPARLLAEADGKRAIITALLAQRHYFNDGDCWYTCAAATEERDGGETCDDTRHGGPCDCGRDTRVHQGLELLLALTQPATGRRG